MACPQLAVCSRNKRGELTFAGSPNELRSSGASFCGRRRQSAQRERTRSAPPFCLCSIVFGFQTFGNAIIAVACLAWLPTGPSSLADGLRKAARNNPGTSRGRAFGGRSRASGGLGAGRVRSPRSICHSRSTSSRTNGTSFPFRPPPSTTIGVENRLIRVW